MRRAFRLTIYRPAAKPPEQPDINTDLQWLCAALGLVGNRDKNHSQYRIFVALIKAQQTGEMLSSEALATQTDLTRATVVHHLQKLVAAGLVRDEHERYRLQANSVGALIDHLRAEMEQSMAELDELSARIDRRLGLR